MFLVAQSLTTNIDAGNIAINMIKSHKETQVEEKDVVDDFVCNNCGNSCKDKCGINHEGLLETSVCGGYAAKLGDMVEYKFSICEDCLKEMFEKFVIAPEKIDHFGE